MKKLIVYLLLLTLFSCATSSSNMFCDLCAQPDSFMVGDTEVMVIDYFTPNGDGFNDLFSLYVTTDSSLLMLNEVFESFTFTIKTRLGKKIFEVSNADPSFDGFSEDGKLGPDGIYNWELVVDDISYEGSVALLLKDRCIEDYDCFDECRGWDQDPALYIDCN